MPKLHSIALLIDKNHPVLTMRLQIIENYKLTGQLAHSLTENQKQQIAYLKRATEALENSLLQLGQMIALYSDW